MSHSPMAEHDLLSRLGLSDGASEDEVESAHNDVVAFLQGAPGELRTWARGQLAAADEAYALLSDHAGAATRPTAVPAVRVTAQPSAARRPKARPAQVVVAEAPRLPFLRRIGRLGRALIAVGAICGVLVVGYAVYASDLPSVPGLTGTPAPDASQATIDTARVAQLMQAIQANPRDVAALQELGDLYFGVNDYGVAAEWEQKVLDIEPNNVTAHLALGAANFNLGNSADAESHWRRVIELNPSDTSALVEAHYDLGFMYFSANPPDVDKTIVEWQTVIDLSPDSDIAQTVATHLATLEQWNASGSPAASGSPSASGSPAPSVRPTVTPLPTATAGQ